MIGNGQQLRSGGLPERFAFDDFNVSWAGPCGKWLCFGSDDGKLRFSTSEGNEFTDITRVAESGEAINGLATIGNCHAVSTRADITFLWNLFVPGAEQSARIPSGAHGILATPAGFFVAPMGTRGLMILKGSDTKSLDIHMANDAENPLYFYRSIALIGASDRDVIVSAVRGRGIAAVELKNDLQGFDAHTISPAGIDVVDVCSLEQHLAVAAIGRDGTILLFRDILNHKDPATFKFSSIEGVAYRILSLRGHVFVLTSNAFYVLENLAKRAGEGFAATGNVTRILTLPMSAIDANLFQEQYVVIVDDQNHVHCLDTLALDGQTADQWHERAASSGTPDFVRRHPKMTFDTDRIPTVIVSA